MRLLVKPLRAQRACFFIEVADEQDIELRDIGVRRHEVAGVVAVYEAAQRQLDPSPIAPVALGRPPR